MTPAQADPAAAAGLDTGKDGDCICPPSPSPLPAPPPPPPIQSTTTTTTTTTSAASGAATEELECKICYQRYNSHNRRPKLLPCLHRVCSRCLGRMLSAGTGAEGQACLPCPFCRHETLVSRYQVARLPDDANIMSRLTTKPHAAARPSSLEERGSSCEVVLTPRSLAASSSSSASSPSSPGPSFHSDSTASSSAANTSNCLVITIMEVQGGDPNRHDSSSHEPPPSSPTSSSNYYYPAVGTGGEPSLDSVSVGSAGPTAEQDALAKLCNNVPRVLVWLLGFFYFGSLPLGIYLLVIQRVTLGIVCVSLVPSSLTVCLVYGFCQCLCQGMCDCSSRG